ncbi:MAG: peroxidase family protein [Bacteroidota bacterium]
MQRRPLLFIFFLACSVAVLAQGTLDVNLYRTIDGSQNNLSNPDWGRAHTNILRLTGNAYADEMSAPNGANRPNPRVISNALFAQNALLGDVMELSDFIWVWGQFIDHDFGLTPDGPEPAIVPVPAGDPSFDPLGLGSAVIPMMRNAFDPTTGTDPQNPRQHPNEITAFIDGSGVYGSDQERADWLRSFEDGKLKVSAGNFLPFNTLDGEQDGAIDPSAPHMDDAVGVAEKFFIAGDPRANENVLLLAFHTLFVREHNRVCDELLIQHPDWNDEQLYQHARKMVGGMIAAITYEEWLPVIGVEMEPYQGYDDSRIPQVSNLFTAAAFRLGHTLLSGDLVVMDNDGNPMQDGTIALRDIFFRPLALVANGGLDPFIKGMATQTQQRADAKIIDDVRNFLFGPPEAGIGGLDLAAININRGRERGLPDFNSIREFYGLGRYSFFQQINPDPQVFSTLISLYADLNNIDAWVGLLAEAPTNNHLFGPTIMAILKQQFGDLREGDRFYYENDPVLNEEEKNWIKTRTMHDVIMDNTGITLMQDDVFESMSHDEICDNMTSTVGSSFATESGQPVSDVNVSLTVNGTTSSLNSDTDGNVFFGLVAACDAESLTAERIDAANNGVSTLDIIRIQRHILGVQSLSSPYKHIAADVDNSGAISVSDIIEIRKVVLSVSTAFPNNTIWRFVAADYEFENPDSPLAESFPEANETFDVLSKDFDRAYVAIKVGDVTEDAILNVGGEQAVDDRSLATILPISVQDMVMEAGESYQIPVAADRLQAIEGFQFALDYDAELVSIQSVEVGALPNMNANNFALDEVGQLVRASWNGSATLEAKMPLLVLNITALEAVPVSSAIGLSADAMLAAAYDSSLEPIAIQWGSTTTTADPTAFTLYQNQPNPFDKTSMVPFFMEESGWARLSVYDLAGKLVLEQTADFDKGHHQWIIKATDFAVDGVYNYRIETANAQSAKRLIIKR